MNDGELFINHTIEELRYLLVENFEETIVIFNGTLENIEDEFHNYTDNITVIIHLDEMKNITDQFVNIVKEYNTNAGELNNMKSIKQGIETNIGEILDICKALNSRPPCPDLETQLDNVGELLASIDITIPTVTDDQLQNLNDLTKIFDDVESALNEVNISSVFGDITDQIGEVKTTLADQADSLIGPIQDNIGDIFTQTGSIVDDMKSLRDDYFPYFKTATLVLGSFFVVVLAIFLLGVCCGSCSKRGGQSASGAATLLFSTNIILILLAVLLFLLTTIMFTVGALSQKLLCKTLEDPADSELFTFVSPLISDELGAVYGNDSVTIDIAEVIANIHSGMALYPLLQLNYVYDINSLANWTTEFGVDVAIEEGRGLINETIGNFTTYKETFDSVRGDIEKLGDDVDIALDTIEQLLNSGVLVDDIQGYINTLEEISSNIPNEEPTKDLKKELDNVIDNVKVIVATLNNATDFFNTSIGGFLEGGTLKEKISEIFGIIEKAFNELMDETSPWYILTFFDESIIAPILLVVDDYIEFAIASANDNIGKTTPLSKIYNATYTDICQEIVNPFNAGGVWMQDISKDIF